MENLNVQGAVEVEVVVLDLGEVEEVDMGVVVLGKRV